MIDVAMTIKKYFDVVYVRLLVPDWVMSGLMSMKNHRSPHPNIVCTNVAESS